MGIDYQKWLRGNGCCCGHTHKKVDETCDCDSIWLELSKQHTDDLILQDEIDTKLDISAYTPTDLSDYYTKEEVDELIPDVPSLSGYATEQWVLDKHYISGVDLSDYYTKEQVDALIPSGSPVSVDSELSLISTNPVQNKVITEALNGKLDASAYTPTDLSNYATKSELIQYINNLQQQINSLLSAVSGCCSQTGETQYRWVTMTGDNDYWCSGTTKYSLEKEQYSEDGINWNDVSPEETRHGNTILEENCVDCGYVPPTPITGDFKYYVTTTGGTVYSAKCNCDVEDEDYDPMCYELVAHDIPVATTGDMKTATVGNCITVIGVDTFVHRNSLTDIYLPSSVGAIKNLLLEGCTSMQNLTIDRETPPTFYQMPGASGVGLFFPTSAQEVIPSGFKIYVPSTAVNAYKTATTWERYSDYIFAI